MRPFQSTCVASVAALLFAAAASAQVTIDFDNLAPGEVVTDQYFAATFSSSAGNQNVAVFGGAGNILCSGPVAGGVTCIEDTYIEFFYPVNGLTFDAIEPNDPGVVARFHIYENGFFSAVVDLTGLGGPGNKPVDLSAYQNVTRLEIVNILADPAELGVGWDNFSFTPNTSPFTYCTAKVNSSGCTPAIGYTGAPSLSAGSGFVISATNIIDNAQGILIYSKISSQTIPFMGGTLCVAPPGIWRSNLLLSGGTAPCGGVLSFDFNDWIANGPDHLIGLGEKVWAQFWSRDVVDPTGTNLTDALSFVVGF